MGSRCWDTTIGASKSSGREETSPERAPILPADDPTTTRCVNELFAITLRAGVLLVRASTFPEKRPLRAQSTNHVFYNAALATALPASLDVQGGGQIHLVVAWAAPVFALRLRSRADRIPVKRKRMDEESQEAHQELEQRKREQLGRALGRALPGEFMCILWAIFLPRRYRALVVRSRACY